MKVECPKCHCVYDVTNENIGVIAECGVCGEKFLTKEKTIKLIPQQTPPLQQPQNAHHNSGCIGNRSVKGSDIWIAVGCLFLFLFIAGISSNNGTADNGAGNALLCLLMVISFLIAFLSRKNT